MCGESQTHRTSGDFFLGYAQLFGRSPIALRHSPEVHSTSAHQAAEPLMVALRIDLGAGFLCGQFVNLVSGELDEKPVNNNEIENCRNKIDESEKSQLCPMNQ